MTEKDDQRQDPAAARSPSSRHIEQLALAFAEPLVHVAQTLAAGAVATLKTMLYAAYERGRADMLAELRAAEKNETAREAPPPNSPQAPPVMATPPRLRSQAG